MSNAPSINYSKNSTKVVYERPNSASTTGKYFEMVNPFYGIEGGYNPEKQTFGLGSNKHQAIAKAEKINFQFDVFTAWENEQSEKPDVLINDYDIDKPTLEVVVPRKAKTIDDFCDRYYAIRLKDTHQSKLSGSSLQALRNYLGDIKYFWKGFPLHFLDTGNIQAHLDHYAEHGKINKVNPNKKNDKQSDNGRAAQALRSCYVNLFNLGNSKKLIEFKYNPANETNLDYIDTSVKRSRCSLDVYKSVFELANHDTTRHYALNFELSLVSKLRVMDLMLIRNSRGEDWLPKRNAFKNNRNYFLTKRLTFKDRIEHAPYSYIDDKNKKIVVFQQKTGDLLDIEFSHKISDDLPTVGEIITKIRSVCDQNSPFLISHPKNIGRAKKGDPVHPDTLSRKFSSYIKELDYDWFNILPPTLGELRSLGARLLEEYDDNNTEEKPRKRSEESSTIDEAIKNAPSANDGISEALGHRDKKVKAIYLAKRNLADDNVGST